MKEVTVKGFKTTKEVTEPEVSKIIGNVPEFVTGRLTRNGPAKFEFQDFHMNHVFDGYNILTMFKIKGGKSGSVTYNSKFLMSEAYKKAEACQKPVVSEYATRSASTDSKKSVFARMISSLIPEQTDNCPFICSTPMGSNPIAIGDTGYMFEIDSSSLECVHRYDPIKELGVHCLASHPLVEQETGYTFNVGVSLFSGAKWNVIKFPPASNPKSTRESIKKAEVLTTFPCRNKTSIPWVHSFAMSKNWICIIEQPSYFNATKVIGSIFSKGVCPKDLNEWKPEQKNRFYIVHKRTGKVFKSEILSSEAFFFYHVMNCYEDDGHLVIDIFTLPSFKIVENLTISNVRSGFKASDKDSPTLQRFVIPLDVSDIRNCPENTNLVNLGMKTTASAIKSEGKICLVPENMSNTTMEASTFNSKLNGGPLRYIWTTGSFAPSYNQHKIFKFDMQTRKIISWYAAEHQFVGESLFVADPNGKDEDDGVIINIVINFLDLNNGDKDFILFLKAKNLEELGRAYFKTDIPISFHGIFAPEP